MSGRILITGATGFTGSHITARFVEAGIPVRCLVRRTANVSALPPGGVSLVSGDVTDPAGLKNSFRGCDFVIHNAGMVSDWGKLSDFHRVNVLGTRNVLDACVQAGICDVILTGSNASYGEENSRAIKDESFPFNSHYPYFLDRRFSCGLNHYRDSKAQATHEGIAFAQKHGLNLTVLEPVWVYGERERNTGFYEYLRSVKSGMFAAPGSRANRFHVVYAGDLAEAYYLAYEKRLEGVNRIIIGNPAADNMNRIWKAFCREAGLKKPFNLPKWIVYPAGFFLELMYTLLGSKKAPLLTRGRVNMFYDNIEYSAKKAEELLGFKCGYTLEEGIRKTVKWYKEEGWL